ncbi:unnamed protein product [Trichobilharzia szidati]|nr:unnamed protein product [Trichobilharzia szidati]
MDSIACQNKKPCSQDDMPLKSQKKLLSVTSAETASAVVGEGQKSTDANSAEEYERLVLSPPPVPLNLEAASAAIYEAACRSSSRSQSISGSTRSLKAHKHEGCTDSHSDHSARSSVHELHKPSTKEILPIHTDTKLSKSPSKWRRYLCCFPEKSHRSPPTKQNNTTPVKHTQSENSKPAGDINISHSNKANDSVNPRPVKGTKFKKTKRSKKSKDIPVSDVVGCTTDKTSLHPSVEDVHSPMESSYQPVLPNTVLNALGSKSENYANTTSISNGCNFTESDAHTESTVPHATVVANANTSKLHYSFRLPTFKRHTNDLYGVKSVGNNERQSLNVQVNNPCNIESTHHVIHQQLQPLNPPWVECDHPDGDRIIPGGCAHDQYPINYDRNGGQGDASSENLESLSPGIDLLGEVDSDCMDKKCLVLDLDETLVHSSFKYVENADFIVPVEINGTVQQVYVRKRPHLDKFLKAIGPLFECVMFTASLRKYADPVCDYIDAASYFRHRLFREACVDHQSNLIKDLSRLGRDVEQICIVDNSPISFLFQPSNALQIVSWFGDTGDQALSDLIPYLTGLANARTVIDYLREFRPPQNAAIAQPATPTWLLLFNNTLPGDVNTSEDSDGGDVDDEDVNVDYHDEDAVLSPHYALT